MSKQTLLSITVAFVVLGVGGFFLVRGDYFNSQNGENRVCPVPASLWQNPLASTWRFRVKGELSAKDTASFTLTDGEATLTVPISTSSLEPTQFWRVNQDRTSTVIPLQDIPLGAHLNGEVAVHVDGSYAGKVFGIDE